MICLNCKHMENMDYTHGTGVCGPLEGETVILDKECVCPKETIEMVERLQDHREEILAQKKTEPLFILCRFNNHERSGKYGGEFFVFKDKDEMISSGTKMITELGFGINDVMIFSSEDQFEKRLDVKLEVVAQEGWA